LRSGIVQKMIVIIIMILVSVGGILAANIVLFRKVQRSILSVANTEIQQVLENARLARTLGQLFSDTTLLVTAFTAQRRFSETEGKRILGDLQAAIASPRIANNAKFQDSLAAFSSKTERLLSQCKAVSQSFGSIGDLDAQIEQGLASLAETIADQELALMVEGEDERRYAIEQIKPMLTQYLRLRLEVLFRIQESSRAYLSAETVSLDYEKQILDLLDRFDSALIGLVTGGSPFADLGRSLRRTISRYKSNVVRLHGQMADFQPLLTGMKRAERTILKLSAEIDEDLARSTFVIHERISADLRTFIDTAIPLFGVVIIVLMATGWYIVRIVRPIVSLADTADRLAAGNIQTHVPVIRSRDEIFALSQAFHRLTAYIQEMALAAQTVGQGDLSVSVSPRSENDVLGNAIVRMIRSLRLADDRVRRQLDILMALHEVHVLITQGVALSGIMRYLLARIVALQRVDYARILLQDPISGGLRHFESAGALGDGFVAPVAALFFPEHEEAVRASRQPVRIDRMPESGDCPSPNPTDPSSRAPIGAYYAIPLVSRDAMKGVIEIVHHSPLSPDPQWVRFLENLSDQAAIAIQHAELIEGLAGLVRARTAELEDQKEKLRIEKDKIHEARIQAEAANRAKNLFLASMSHEFRTPLNAIIGFSQVLVRDERLSLDHRKTIAIINRSGDNLLSLINGVLDMSKIEAGHLAITETAFDLRRLLSDIHDMFDITARGKGLYLTFDLSPDLPRFIKTDKARLRQVLVNLLGNAIKFTDGGGVTMTVSCEAAPDPESPGRTSLRFVVRDTGIGVSPADQTRIFEPFVQAHPDKHAAIGTGLGLSISRALVRLMGGDIQLRSDVGQGAVFSFHVMAAAAFRNDFPEASALTDTGSTGIGFGRPGDAGGSTREPQKAPLSEIMGGLPPKALDRMPVPLREPFREAVFGFDYDATLDLIARIEPDDPSLAEALKARAAVYRFDILQQLFAETGEEAMG